MSRHRVATFACLWVILLGSIAGAAPVISVLDLEPNGISEREMTILVDYLTTRIAGLGSYQVVDRGRREQLLREIEFSNSDCTDEDCQIEIGRLLSANQVVAGSVGRFGDRYVLNLRLLEVATGAVVRSSSYRYRPMERILDEADRIVRDLLLPGRGAGAASAAGAPRGAALEVSAGAGFAAGSTRNWYRSPSVTYTHFDDALGAPGGATLVDFALRMPGGVATVGFVYQFNRLLSVGLVAGASATFVRYVPSDGVFSDRTRWSPVVGVKVALGDKQAGVAPFLVVARLSLFVAIVNNHSDVAMALSLAKRAREIAFGLPALAIWQFMEGGKGILRRAPPA